MDSAGLSCRINEAWSSVDCIASIGYEPEPDFASHLEEFWERHRVVESLRVFWTRNPDW
jgi:hypothetical protein